MEYTTRLDENSTSRAHVNYQCPCGCTAGLMYDRTSGSEHLGQCCCGRLLWLGDDAEAVVTSHFDSAIGYDLDTCSVTLPWGDFATAVLAVPARSLDLKESGAEHAHDHDHEGHEHSHEHEHHHEHEEEHDHEHHDDGHVHVARAGSSLDEHGHDHEHEGHEHSHDHQHDDHDTAHHDHEHHDDGHIHVERPRVKDLVCGMMIDPATAAATSVYKGETYYFCAIGCKQQFDADPTRYVRSTGILSRIFGRS